MEAASPTQLTWVMLMSNEHWYLSSVFGSTLSCSCCLHFMLLCSHDCLVLGFFLTICAQWLQSLTTDKMPIHQFEWVVYSISQEVISIDNFYREVWPDWLKLTGRLQCLKSPLFTRLWMWAILWVSMLQGVMLSNVFHTFLWQGAYAHLRFYYGPRTWAEGKDQILCQTQESGNKNPWNASWAQPSKKSNTEFDICSVLKIKNAHCKK